MGNVVPAEFFLFSQRMRRALYYDRFSLMDALHKIAFLHGYAQRGKRGGIALFAPEQP